MPKCGVDIELSEQTLNHGVNRSQRGKCDKKRKNVIEYCTSTLEETSAGTNQAILRMNKFRRGRGGGEPVVDI